MKYFVLFALAFAFLLVGIIPVYAQYIGDIEKMASWPPICIGIKCPPLFESSLNALVEPIDKSKIVLVGKIIEVKPILKQNQTEYGIKVDEYIKTPKSFDMITAIGDGIYKNDFSGSNEVTYYNTPIFKKDDTVFVYLNSENGTYKISPYSFAISKNIPTGHPQNLWLTVDKSEYQHNDTITISSLVKKAYIFESSLSGQDSSVYLIIRNPDNQVYENKTLDVRPDGTFSHSFKIKGDLGIDGQYGYDIKIGDTTWSTVFSYDSGHIRSPLKQFKSGIPIDEIQCKEGLQLIFKSNNGNPACVKPETKAVLIERGWGSKLETMQDSKTSTKALDKNYTLQINDNIFEIRYSIIGSLLQEIIVDINAKSLIVNVEGLDNGHMVIEIPRKLIDARNWLDGKSGEDVDFFVLVDGSEVDFEEVRSISARTLTIPLKNGSSQIEIIGTIGHP